MSSSRRRLSEVGLTPSLYNMAIAALVDRGLLLVCGSTGSGKTDTASALVREAAALGRTIAETDDENPIDGRVIDAGDLVGVPETLRAIDLARQCLTVGVLRSGAGPNAVNRLIDMGADSVGLQRAKIWLIMQRLARGLCMSCRTARAVSKAEFAGAGLGKEAWHMSGGYVYGAEGCPECDNGHLGHFVLAEGFFRVDSGRLRQVDSISNHATLRVLSGQIDLEEARTLV